MCQMPKTSEMEANKITCKSLLNYTLFCCAVLKRLLILPETLEHEEPIPCNALAKNRTLKDLPNAKTLNQKQNKTFIFLNSPSTEKLFFFKKLLNCWHCTY